MMIWLKCEPHLAHIYSTLLAHIWGWYGTRTRTELDQIWSTFEPDHHKGIRIWPGAGSVLVRISTIGYVPVLARCAKRHRPKSVARIWPRTYDGSGPDLDHMIFAIWVLQ
ncbi:hypothetical protein XENTR_v10008525 [Xenopus tropicalis]|nr:hypothetical protein XENTR_v10008525 [Xenopus tropicalis]